MEILTSLRSHFTTPRHQKEASYHCPTENLIQHNTGDIAVDELGTSPLRRPVLRGRHHGVEALLELGADVTVVDESGRTLLHIAASEGHHQVVKVLLRFGADVSAADKDGQTPLHVATLAGHVQIVELLLQHNATVSAVDKDGRTALDLCKRCVKRLDGETVKQTKTVLKRYMASEPKAQQTLGCNQRDTTSSGNHMTTVQNTKAAACSLACRLMTSTVERVSSTSEHLPGRENRQRYREVLQQGRENKSYEMLHLLSTLFKSPDVSQHTVKPPEPTSRGPQRCFGKDTMTVDFHKSLSEAFNSIALIKWNQMTGTGFRVGKDYVITNWHLVQQQSSGFGQHDVRSAVFHFNSLSRHDVTCAMFAPYAIVEKDVALDFAVLKLDLVAPLHQDLAHFRKASRRTLPSALSRFSGIEGHRKLTLAGHPDGNSKVVDVQCEVVDPLDNPVEFQRRHNRMVQWSQANFGRDVFPRFDDPNRVLYHASVSFKGGSSGSPGFVPSGNQKACVAVLHAFQHPDVPRGCNVAIPPGYTVEQGVKMEAIFNYLNVKNPGLCREIFGVN